MVYGAVDGLSEGLDVGVGWIELAADPLQPLGVLLVARIGERGEELAVSRWPADIFGRAASDCFDEALRLSPCRSVFWPSLASVVGGFCAASSFVPSLPSAYRLARRTAEVIVNGNPEMKGRRAPAGALPTPVKPTTDFGKPIPRGLRDELKQRGSAGFAQWLKEQSRVLLIVHSWRSATPKLKFAVINLPFDTLKIEEITIKKRQRVVINATEQDVMRSYVFWDGKRYRYEPGPME